MEGEILDEIYAETLGLQKQIFELCLILCSKGVITKEDVKKISAIAEEVIDKLNENANENV